MSSSESDEEVLENKEITEPKPNIEEPITRKKKPRSEKQIAALARAREKRAEKIGDRKKIKEAENKLIEENREMLTEMALGKPNIEEEILDSVLSEAPTPPPKPILKKPKPKKKKKVKKTIVNNYYEEEDSESDEELIEEQNNFYVNHRGRGRARRGAQMPIAPTTLIDDDDDYEEEVIAENNYSFNPYGNIRFC